MSGEARIPATSSQTVGPFFHFALGTNAALARLAPPGTKGETVHLTVRVTDGDGEPVSDALVELWQADADGRYVDAPPAAPATPRFCGFGRAATDQDGVAGFETIRPGRVPTADGRLQAAHINICLFSRGLLRQIYTRLYFAGDASLLEDAVLGLVPAERRPTLLAERAGAAGHSWRFDIRLQGDRETVFFDL